MSDGIRLDKWLWAARFYKTRSMAGTAIGGGKVQLNSQRAKRAKSVHPGDELRIRKGVYEYTIVVKALSEHRGPAADARALYEETQESIHRRESAAIQLRSISETTFRTKGRPTKKERRDIERFQGPR